MTVINPHFNIANPLNIYLTHNNRDYALHFVHSDEYEKAGSRRTRPRHRHSLYHIILIRQGEGTFLIDGKGLQVASGMLLFISPGQQHSLGLLDGEKIIYGEVTFEFLDGSDNQLDIDFGSLLSLISGEYLKVPLFIDSDDFLSVDSMLFFLKGMASLKDFNDKHLYFQTSSSVRLMNLLTDMAEQFILLQKENHRLSPMERIQSYIENNYQLPLTLVDLEKVGSLSAKYISRRFKEVYGETPIHYRDSLRIEAACKLLKDSHYSIGEIAGKCGFADIYYFSKIFRKRCSCAPGEYRERIRSSS